MGRKCVSTAVVGALAVLSSPAFAVDLVNEDEKSYQVVVIENFYERAVRIESRATLADVCDDCSIEIDSGDEIDAAGTEVVTIKNGGLVKSGS